MILLSRRCLLAVAAVVDVALHARPSPVAAKALAARHELPPHGVVGRTRPTITRVRAAMAEHGHVGLAEHDSARCL